MQTLKVAMRQNSLLYRIHDLLVCVFNEKTGFKTYFTCIASIYNSSSTEENVDEWINLT